MPEVSENAALLFATSYQSLQRLNKENVGLYVCQSAVTIIFACIYLEETIDIVLKELDELRELKKKSGHDQPSLLEKYIWFCNNYVIEEEEKLKDPFKKINGKYIISPILDYLLPEFNIIRKLRNEIAHGNLENFFPHLNRVLELRQAAKDIAHRTLDKSGLISIRKVDWNMTEKFLEETYSKFFE